MDAKVGDSFDIAIWITDGDLGVTGSTVTLYLYDESNNLTVNGGSAAEVGGGLYRYTNASTYDIAGVWPGYVVASGGSTTPSPSRVPFEIRVDRADSTLIQAIWDAMTSALTTSGSIGKLIVDKLGLISTGSITVSAPVIGATSAVTVVRGDDYNPTDGSSRTISWTSTSWPSVTGATSISVTVYKGGAGGVDWTHAGEVVDSSTVRLTAVTSTESGALVPGTYNYDLQCTLTTSSKVTLARGQWTVTQDYST